MNRLPYLLFVFALIAIGCEGRKEISSTELYGNSFIHVDVMSNFRAPFEWKSCELFDSAFHISIPDYMKVSQTVPLRDNCESIIYTYNDTTNSEDFHYGRIGIDYYRYSSPQFSKATDNLLHQMESLMKPLVTAALKGGMKVNDTLVVGDGELLNGPFYDIHSFFSNDYQRRQYFGYDAYYRRSGHATDSPVSTHIFLSMNSTESAVITVSHYDKDSLIFENLFKIIKTFRWNKLH